VYLFVWVITFDLSGLGDPDSSYATAGLALRIIWTHKPHHYVKVGTPSGGETIIHSAFYLKWLSRLYNRNHYTFCILPEVIISLIQSKPLYFLHFNWSGFLACRLETIIHSAFYLKWLCRLYNRNHYTFRILTEVVFSLVDLKPLYILHFTWSGYLAYTIETITHSAFYLKWLSRLYNRNHYTFCILPEVVISLMQSKPLYILHFNWSGFLACRLETIIHSAFYLKWLSRLYNRNNYTFCILPEVVFSLVDLKPLYILHFTWSGYLSYTIETIIQSAF